MKDYGLWNYRYWTSTPTEKHVITLSWSKTLNFIKVKDFIYDYKKCEYIVYHVYIDDQYTKADIAAAKQFYEILIRSYHSS